MPTSLESLWFESAVEARVARPSHTPLDGTFLAWANPSGGAASVGDYPFVFDCPDAATHLELALPSTVTAQIAAFAQQVSLYESPAAYVSSQASEGVSSPSRSFIPSGLMSPDGTPRDPPEPHALIAGHVLEAATRVNSDQRGRRIGGRSSRPLAVPSTPSSTLNCWPTLRVPETSSPDGSGCRAA